MVIASPRALRRGYDPVRTDNEDAVEHRREIADGINSILQGNLNATDTVTLAVSVATTALSDSRIGPDSFIGFMPTTANAAAELPTLYVSSRTEQAATLTHANNAQADRTFAYLVIG